mmetsp:Transcript_29558/g.53613  ORF Transcript_29558/g.53613 Transcript_29558/m.53613 type:complete len:756 (-) Transcript_29558:108-2375(-)
MNSFVDQLLCRKHDDESSGDELHDKDAVNLSHVGEAVHQVLGRHHNRHHKSMWNVTTGKIIGSVDDTPKSVWDTAADPGTGNDDWFPEKLAEIIGRTEAWCDVMSLGPPDGKFLTAFQTAMQTLAERSKTTENPIVIRMLFGNIAGMPVNCSKVIKALTKDLPKDNKLHIWVGAWRKGFSWNHAKLIAVDGVYLHTGGHNLWDAHYLSNNPVHDLSMELEGKVARDGHRFANQQWEFIESKQSTCVGCVIDTMPDYLPLVLRTRVTVSEWPKDTVPVFPPRFTTSRVANTANQSRLADKATDVPLISIGRQGSMVFRSRPSDDAIIAMINSSQTIIRLVLQDLGPVCLPGTKKALPGLKWPKEYLAAIGKAIYERGVDVEMVLSNPNSIPGGLKGTEANYGNGWDCVDVAAEIIKRIQKQYSEVDDAKLRAMVVDNLRICYVRHDKSSQYEDGNTIGLHSKHLIVDDKCCYIGSQNLYMCDLAEWGIVVDSEDEVKKIMNDYFLPMWENSYTGEDVDVERVMDGLNVDRDGENTMFSGMQSTEQLMPHCTGTDNYDIEKDDSAETDETESPLVASKEDVDVASKDDADPAEETEEGEEVPITARDDDDVDQDSAPDEREMTVTPTQEAALSNEETASRASSDEETASLTPSPKEITALVPIDNETASNAPSAEETAPCAPSAKETTTLAVYDGDSPEDTPEETPEKEEGAIVIHKQEDIVSQKSAETKQDDDNKKGKGMSLDCCGFAQSFNIASE